MPCTLPQDQGTLLPLPQNYRRVGTTDSLSPKAPAAQELEKPPTCSRLPQIPHCKKKVAPSFCLSQQSSCLDPPTALQLLDTLCVFRRVTS